MFADCRIAFFYQSIGNTVRLIVMVCVIDLVSFFFARFNVTFDDAVKRSVSPSALYLYIMLCSLVILNIRFRAATRRFFELLLRRSAYRFLFSLQADSGHFVISTLCCAQCSPLNWL